MGKNRATARLRSNLKKILALVSDLSEENFHKKINDKQWSIAEILTHLTLAESRLVEALAKNDSKRNKALFFLKRYLLPLKLLVRYTLFKVQAPEVVIPSEALKLSKSEVIQRYIIARDKTLSFADSNIDSLRDYYITHPFFGTMDGVQTLDFNGYHELRHLDQINKILRML